MHTLLLHSSDSLDRLYVSCFGMTARCEMYYETRTSGATFYASYHVSRVPAMCTLVASSMCSHCSTDPLLTSTSGDCGINPIPTSSNSAPPSSTPSHVWSAPRSVVYPPCFSSSTLFDGRRLNVNDLQVLASHLPPLQWLSPCIGWRPSSHLKFQFCIGCFHQISQGKPTASVLYQRKRLNSASLK